MTSPQPLHDPRRQVADADPAALLADLARAKAAFQLRAISAFIHGRTAAAPGEANG